MNAGAVPKRRIDAKSRPGLVDECLGFFGVASPDEWRTHYLGMECAFRRSRADQCDVGAISAWLRLGEQEAEKLDTRSYDRSAFRAALDETRALTVEPPEVFEPRVRALLRRAGVGFVLVPAIPRARVSGVARWLSPQRPLNPAFTRRQDQRQVLVHLLSRGGPHPVACRGDKKSVWLDDAAAGRVTGSAEQEANTWAADKLIPPRHVPEFVSLYDKASVRAFASKVGVHPGIVVGRLQHDRLIPFGRMNDLKATFRFVEASGA